MFHQINGMIRFARNWKAQNEIIGEYVCEFVQQFCCEFSWPRARPLPSRQRPRPRQRAWPVGPCAAAAAVEVWGDKSKCTLFSDALQSFATDPGWP